MIRVAVVGCTGKLGSVISKNIVERHNMRLAYAVARRGNQFVGKGLSEIIGSNDDMRIIDDIELAEDCDVYIDCTNAETFISNNIVKYEKMKKPVVIATTGFTKEDREKIRVLAEKVPVFLSGNFSIALHHFLETLQFAGARIDNDTDIQIVEYHHNQKKDAPSGTALMIQNVLTKSNSKITADKIDIHSVRGGNIFGEHEVIFANSKNEVVTFKHQVFSREAFAEGAVEVSGWLIAQDIGIYTMDDFCGNRKKED